MQNTSLLNIEIRIGHIYVVSRVRQFDNVLINTKKSLIHPLLIVNLVTEAVSECTTRTRRQVKRIDYADLAQGISNGYLSHNLMDHLKLDVCHLKLAGFYKQRC